MSLSESNQMHPAVQEGLRRLHELIVPWPEWIRDPTGIRWGLILLFMFLKAGFIIAIFMHIAWERLVLICAILLPPLCLMVFIGLMAIEADYTFLTRLTVFGQAPQIVAPHH